MQSIMWRGGRAAWACAAGAVACSGVLARAHPDLALELQRRDPQTGALRLTQERVDPATVGVVVIDMWNFHWCKTSTQRVAALVPRMNRVLAEARALGMRVFLCPTDVADNYVGTGLVEPVMMVTPLPLPQARTIACPPAPDGGGCTCGKERCLVNYGWDAMNPELVIGEHDLMPNDPERLYALCRARGITRLIYMGVHTQVCLLGKSVGLRRMLEAGFECILARDLTDAHGRYDPEHGVTPDGFTATVVAHFEKYLAPSINFAETLRRNGDWDDHWIVDPVRIAPWGTLRRPHLFEDPITVTLTIPWHPAATIHYTLDGSAPSLASAAYTKPFVVAATTRLRAIAYERGRVVSLPSAAFYAKLGPRPPLPDLYLSDLQPWRAVGPGHAIAFGEDRYSPDAQPAQRDHNNRGQSLRLRGQDYTKGLGVHAPNQLIYDLKPQYRRFVALAGVDEHLVDISNGSNLARYPSVVFKVFLDGREVSASPVMRLAADPWRFDVPLPPGSRRLSLVATDAGDGNREDLANWVNAGFVLQEPPK